ncbi:hypothetical protein [Acinetobacter sp. MD2(2019)]|uniref:COG3014 family protein n=1 Tax=Acinetobacter sp. MD2(2019) TaxID=2605273 RepID=UPI002D1F036E|nr:hypothetical protein [Acinetobacter sp. MD2(2019)]MEB3753550.1 hypothetical protein [Acinetobacter sp. MD2(2019)]
MTISGRKSSLAAIITLSVATTNLAHAATFKTYKEDSDQFRTALNQNNEANFTEKFKKSASKKDGVLYLLEQARIQQVDQNYQASLDTYKKAFELLDKQNHRSKISASRVGFQALSMLSNDSVVPYLVPPYEQVIAHISQAKNYIYLKDMDAAAVEMRIAQQIQRDIELAHEQELAKKVEKAKKKNAEPEQEPETKQIDDALVGLNPIAGKIKNTYQNSYSFYMAASLWEVLGEYNDALVDYKKAYELQPDPQIAADIQRVDKASKQKDKNVPVIIFIEQGLVPQKVENKLVLPGPNGLINIAFASYEPKTYQTPQATQVLINNKKIQNSYVLNDIGALAVKELKEHTTATVSRQIMRTTAKYIAQEQLGRQLGTVGQLAGMLMNTATDHADLRSWSTLPSNTQVARLNLAPGKYQLQLANAGKYSSPISIDTTANQTVFVYAYDINNKISVSSSSFSKP